MRALNRAPLRIDRTTNRPIETQAFTTFGYRAPLQTHFITYPCSIARCKGWTQGWTTTLDPMREEHLPFIRHILRGAGGRRWFKGPMTPEGYLTFNFPGGQSCFENSHSTRNYDVPEIYVVRGGDFRMPPHLRNPHAMSFDNWVEAFDRNQRALVSAHDAMRE
jgi:hypothetical protein